MSRKNEISPIDALHPKAKQALAQNLTPQERIQVVVHGSSNQAIIGTQHRVFVYKKGFMAGASFGSELTSWDYQAITGVQVHTGMMSGAMIIQGPGLNGTATNYWKNDDSSPHKAPNAIPLNRPFEPAQEGAAQLRNLMSQARGQASQPSAGVGASLADELTKLAALRDAGVLTPHEFEAQKQRLLRG